MIRKSTDMIINLSIFLVRKAKCQAMLWKLPDSCKIKRHKKMFWRLQPYKYKRSYSCSFLHLSWEFYPLWSSVHWLGQNDYCDYPYRPDRRSQFHNLNYPLMVSPEDQAGIATLNVLSLTHNFLLPCLYPSFLVAWKSIWGINSCAVWPWIHSSPFLCLT